MDEFDVQRITLRPGDVLAVKVRRRLTMEIHDRILAVVTDALQRAGRGDVPVIVTDEEIAFAVIEKPAA